MRAAPGRMLSRVLLVVCCAFVALRPSPSVAADAAGGKTIAQRWCASCHLVEREQAGPDLPLEPGLAKRWILLLVWPDLEQFYRLNENKQWQARDEQRRDRVAQFGKIIVGVLLSLAIVGTVCKRGQTPCHRKAIA